MPTQNYSTSPICKELAIIKENYDKNISIVEGLLFNQKKLIRTIEFYTNSKYLGGQLDELGREKPFYNIVNAMCDVENAGKDIDTKDIHVVSDDGQHYVEAFLMSKDIYEWMKEENFGKTLNDIRDQHTRYGSLLIKKCTYVDDDGNKSLKIEMPEWKNTITDQINILKGAIVECHYMTASELYEKTEWSSERIDEAVGLVSGQGYGHRVPVFEVRGTFPKSFIKELNDQPVTTKDKKTFSYQLFYLAGTGSAQDIEQAQTTSALALSEKLIPLYWEDNTEKCYKYLARKKRDGRSFGVGVVEEGEEAQVWTNDAVLKQFRAMEYTTKVIGQSASRKLKGRNLLTEVDDGQILEHEADKPITSVSLLPSGGLQQYENLISQWFTQYERATSSYSAQRGESPTSRTSFKLQAAVLQQSGSVVRDLQEELAIFIGEVFDEWIIPYLAKNRLNREHILAHDFTLQELKEIDNNFASHTANEMAINQILQNKIVTVDDYAKFKQDALSKIQQTKAQRFLVVPKDYYKKIKAKTTVIIGDEKKDRAAMSDALIAIMKVYEGNPELVNDPVLTQIFMKLIELSDSGLSPVSVIGAIQEKAAIQAQQKSAPQNKVSESINFKDLPPDGQVQLAAQAGLKINPPTPQPEAQPSSSLTPPGPIL